ncbi:unnamed protein product [Schistosoma mattheei]|uniref:Uncharacterized protein n=1 Tax=Schistosoma mattheei TaxID=31246 RepID=A0A3P7ZLA4_9TREM|nr:unnamed protein product [Schistosoma mattheei]
MGVQLDSFFTIIISSRLEIVTDSKELHLEDNVRLSASLSTSIFVFCCSLNDSCLTFKQESGDNSIETSLIDVTLSILSLILLLLSLLSFL